MDLKTFRASAKQNAAMLEECKNNVSVFETDSSEALVDDSLNLCLQNFKSLIEAGVADSKTVSLMTKVIDAYVKVESLKVKQMAVQQEATPEQISRIMNKLKELQDAEGEI